jgi:hypothetical protein
MDGVLLHLEYECFHFHPMFQSSLEIPSHFGKGLKVKR